MLLAGCPSTDDDVLVGEPVIGLVPVGVVEDGDLLPQVLDGDAFSAPLVADQVVTIEANNDERAGDLYVMIFDGDDRLVAGPGVDDYRFEYLNADWGCSTEPANQPPDRPRGCPDNSFVAAESGVHTIVLSAHDGLEASVGYSMTVESEGLLLHLDTTNVP